MQKKIFVTFSLFLSLALFGATATRAEYPERPVTLVVGLGAGSSATVVARLIGDKLAEKIGKPVIVENRVGAEGIVAVQQVARAEPDGYTLLFLIDGMLAPNKFIDTARELAPIAYLGTVDPPWVLVSPTLTLGGEPVKTLEVLLRFARDHPRKVTYGAGSFIGRMCGYRMLSLSGAEAVRSPYLSDGAAFNDVMAERVAFICALPTVSRGLVESGKLRALAMTGEERNPAYPDVPTMREAFPELHTFGTLIAMSGIAARKELPPHIAAFLEQAVREALAEPQLQETLKKQRFTVEFRSSGELRDFMLLRAATLKETVEND